MIAKDTECNLELKKHVNLIHCSNNLTLVQRKLFNALLFNAYPELGLKQQFSIRTKTLCEIVGYKSNDYKSLKKALLELMVITIEWNVISGDANKLNDKWRASSVLAAAKLEGGVCIYEYSSIMTELFYQPEIYGRINISLLPKFKSSYGLALYENCIRYNGIPQTPWLSLEIFRKLMGVDEKKYSIFRDFKKRVLDMAINEVNLYSPMIIEPELKRFKNKVISIRFLLKTKLQNTFNRPLLSDVNGGGLKDNSTIKNNALLSTLKDAFSMSAKSIENILSKYELNYINEKATFVLNSESFKLGKIRQISAYLMEALKNDYRYTKPTGIVIAEKHRKKEEQELAAKKKQEEIRLLYSRYVASAINERLAKFSPEKTHLIIEQFEISLKGGVRLIYTWFQKRNLEHPAVKALFNDFLRNYEPETFKDILTFEQFEPTLGSAC